MAMGPHLSIITVNVNGLNAPTKRQRLAEWMQKQDPYIYCLQETHLKTRDTYRLKVKGWKKIFHANRDQKKAGVAIFISDKIRLSNKGCEKRQRTLQMIKGSIQEEDITIINIYAPNIGAPQYVRYILSTFILFMYLPLLKIFIFLYPFKLLSSLSSFQSELPLY